MNSAAHEPAGSPAPTEAPPAHETGSATGPTSPEGTGSGAADAARPTPLLIAAQHGPPSPTGWGRVDADGTVYLRLPDGERAVGSWQAGDAQAGLAHFARRYDDLATEVELLEQRLDSGAGDPRSTIAAAQAHRDGLATAAVVGDVGALEARLSSLIERAGQRQAEVAARRADAKRRAVAAREALVAEAEAIAAKEGSWKAGGDRIRAIAEEWRAIKINDRKADDALWKRFRTAREEFNRRRGAHFAALDEQQGEVRARKEQLIAEAETLAESTDWAPTANRLKALMREWKDAGHAAKGADDALWKRFRAAQDTFFARRSETLKARDDEFVANQRHKEAIIGELESLDLVGDASALRGHLRRLQERYDGVGHVPRDAIRGLDERMRSAEQRVRQAAEKAHAAAVSVPTANPLLDSMREAVQKAEVALEKAVASGDQGRVAEATAALEARRGWLADAQRSAGR